MAKRERDSMAGGDQNSEAINLGKPQPPFYPEHVEELVRESGVGVPAERVEAALQRLSQHFDAPRLSEADLNKLDADINMVPKPGDRQPEAPFFPSVVMEEESPVVPTMPTESQPVLPVSEQKPDQSSIQKHPETAEEHWDNLSALYAKKPMLAAADIHKVGFTGHLQENKN
jgi:hypothetical protein